jgi:pimeloyl-ACP methyl ester carboxylesterase
MTTALTAPGLTPAPMSRCPALLDYATEITLGADVRVAYADSGQPGASTAAPLVLIHGVQDEADTWQRVFPALAQTRRVIALDLPGFGLSDKRARRYNVPLYAGMIVGLLDALKIQQAALAGNSLGAMIAEFVAITQPERVSALTLISGTLFMSKRPPAPLTGLLQSLLYERRYFEELRKSPDAAFATLRPYYGNLDALPEALRTFLYQRVTQRVWDEAQRRASLSIRQSFLPFFLTHGKTVRRAPAIQAPTTVIWGSQDQVFPPANGPDRANAQAGARFIPIEGCGHLPQQETPERVIEALRG